MPKRPLVIVDYEDITGRTSWTDEESALTHEALVCRLVGWKLKQNRKQIIITSNIGVGTKDCADVHVIPRGCIKSIRRVE